MINTLIAIFNMITVFALMGIVILIFGWGVAVTVSAVIEKIKKVRE